jgi:hypothetical protein
MTKEETDLIGEAIDFYNLNHFKGEKTKKQLVKLKKRIEALTIPVIVSSKFLCGKENQHPLKRCKEQCGFCEGDK